MTILNEKDWQIFENPIMFIIIKIDMKSFSA